MHWDTLNPKARGAGPAVGKAHLERIHTRKGRGLEQLWGFPVSSFSFDWGGGIRPIQTQGQSQPLVKTCVHSQEASYIGRWGGGGAGVGGRTYRIVQQGIRHVYPWSERSPTSGAKGARQQQQWWLLRKYPLNTTARFWMICDSRMAGVLSFSMLFSKLVRTSSGISRVSRGCWTCRCNLGTNGDSLLN